MGMLQVVQPLLSKHKTLSSNPNTTKKRKEKKQNQTEAELIVVGM
jgi:hypothetical protein